jgi:hypothetical protein
MALEVDKLKYMSRLIFAAAASLAVARAAAAQHVPGRDLLEFPLGTLAEGPALSRDLPGGLWNPAMGTLMPGQRLELGAAVLATPIEQGVRASVLSSAFRLKASRMFGTVSLAQASVGDILHTEGDPTSIGDEIPYGTGVFSTGLATESHGTSLGVSARYRWGSLDADRGGALSLDGGLVVDRVAKTPIRVAASTFLFNPFRHADSPTYLLAADVPVFRADSIRSLRTGYSVQHTEGRGHEDYAFLSGHYRQLSASAGFLRSSLFGNVSRRVRLGLGLHYGRYTVAIAREDGAAAFGPNHQFLLTSVFP